MLSETESKERLRLPGQKRVNRAGLRLCILRKACWWGWPLSWCLGTWIWGGSHHSINNKSDSLSRSRLLKRCSLCRTLAFLLSLEICYVLSRGYLGDRPSIKTWDTESPVSFPCRQPFRHVTVCCWGVERILCESTGRGFGSLHLPFPFADFALSSFSVTNHCCAYDSMLSPPCEPQKGGCLGDPQDNAPSRLA